MTNEWDAVIIGASAAGLSAAQMLGRSRRRTLVVDAGQPRNRFAAHMHGVLGHDGVDPAALLERGRAEAGAYGVRFAAGRVTDVIEDEGVFRITRDDGVVDTARVVVLATGVRDDLPEVPGLAEGWGRSVLHCPYCHGWEVAGRRLGVLTTSPMGAHQAQLVRQLSDDVTVFAAALEPMSDDLRAGFTARDIRVVSSPARDVRAGDDGLVVTTEDGETHAVDALFTAGTPELALDFAAPLGLERADQPGAPLVVDWLGTTSHPRVFAAGNVVAPFANVPVSMGQGSMAGSAANAVLVADDVARAIQARAAVRNARWEETYAEAERFWTGRVNPTTAAVVSTLTAGSVLDVGSGEGGDAVWLAEHGWRTSAVDVSATAVRRARDLARERAVTVDFVVGDGAASVDGAFDLVIASFLHSWETDFPRIRMLQDAAGRVAPGGRLPVVSHLGSPASGHDHDQHAPVLRTPREELELLALDPETWESELVEIRPREGVAPDGTRRAMEDGVLLLRRRA